MEKKSTNNLQILPNKNIEDCIFTIRDQQVMLDSDIALFFDIDTKRLNEQMKRNFTRFPEDFCFRLNSKEFKTLRSQNATFSSSTKGRKYTPYVYTEHGIVALAGVLKSSVADKMSVEIARKFIEMRKFILENNDILLSLAKLQNRQLEYENETNQRFEQVFNLIGKLDLPKTALFCAGQWFDAFDYITNIINSANKSVILIDPYCDVKALTFLSHKKENVELTIVASEQAKVTQEEVQIFESQYGLAKIIKQSDIHDRYLIIDSEKCYALGASLNYAGKKLFTIHEIEEQDTIQFLINKINE